MTNQSANQNTNRDMNQDMNSTYSTEKFIIGNSSRKPTTPHSFDEIENLLQSIEEEERQKAKLSEGKTSKAKEIKVPKVNKKKGTNIVLKANDSQSNPQSPSQTIIPPTSDLSFVTDEKIYNEIIKYLDAEFPNHKGFLSSKLSFDKDKNVMIGSNTYIAIAIDTFLKKNMPEYRIANLADLEQNLSLLQESFEPDVGLVLRNMKNTKDKLKTKHLFDQLKSRGLSHRDLPVYFNLRGLELDTNLNFNLTDESLYKPRANCLNWKGGTGYSITDDFGLPKQKDKNLPRMTWSSNHALSRCYLSGKENMHSDSSDSDLHISVFHSRIVLARVSGNNYSGGDLK